MKSIISLLGLFLALNAFASSGREMISLVLEQNEVEKLEAQMNEKGFTLSKVQDVFATRGVSPRCPCTSMDLTFTKVNGGKAEEKTFHVRTEGFGNRLTVSIQPASK
jgi:hypothetical protein